MEALMEAYTITHNKKLLTMIPEIKNLMLLPVSKGGLLRNTPEGGPWIEEYPSKQPNLVLNGFMFALMDLHDYCKMFPKIRLRMPSIRNYSNH